MINSKPQFYFLLAILLTTFVLTFFIFKPFLYALVLALIFSAAFKPLHRSMLRLLGGRQGAAALLTMTIATVVVFGPLTLIGIHIFEEASQLYVAAGTDSFSSFLNMLTGTIKSFLPIPILNSASFDIQGLAREGASWFIQHIGVVFSGFARITVSFLVFLIALYYFLKSGAEFKKMVLAISPLQDTDDQFIINKLDKAIGSVLKGGLIIAVIQGFLAGAGFFFFGVPNPVLWGTVAAVTALIPGVGTSLVLIPAIIFLFITSTTGASVGLLVWSVMIVGLVDNFLAPKLIGGGTELHPLIVLLSVLGGIVLFGPVGFLFGPLVVSFLFALIDVYVYVSKKQNQQHING